MNLKVVSAFATAIALSITIGSVSVNNAFACTSDGKSGFAPENNLSIPVDSFNAGPMTESEFNGIIAKAVNYYIPVFAAQGRKYTMIANWKDSTVNAFANRSGSDSEVHMFGGLARHPKMTPDGFMLVICHETGHHLGGAPKNHSFFGIGNWASNEGEADYYATLKCSREMWKNEDNAAVVAHMPLPRSVISGCQKSFDKAPDVALCERAVMAGKDLGDTLADMGKTAETDFDHPDTHVVTKMFDAHPDAQCRLDTYLAGAVCAKASTDPLSDKDARVGTCAQEVGEVVGIRPRCWYKLQVGDGSSSGSMWPKSLR
ncbi:MAG: M48 family metalloprotease [Cryobacterium sp.]|nr:M48 family metalloprotease [Oligoflexia bacterium]